RFRLCEPGSGRTQLLLGLPQLDPRSTVVRLRFRGLRLRLGRRRLCVAEKRAEPARLELALEPAAAQLFGRLVVDGRGLECLANLAGRESEQAIERLALSLRCRGHVALARDLRVAQFRRRREVLLDLVAMFP